jgi:hypothetical protein
METLTIQQKLLRVQTELKAPKNQYNSFGKYKYRNQEDILEAVKPLCAKYQLNLIVTDDLVEIAGLPFVKSVAKVFTDNSEPLIEVAGFAAYDPNRKGMDVAQSTGSSSSYSRKYALNGLFLIDDTKDADSTNTHGKDVAEKSGKPVLPKSGKTFADAKKFVNGDASKIAAIKNKYQVTSEVEQLLLK